MTTKTAVEIFLIQKKLAVIGISRNKKKFGNVIYKELKSKGYDVYPVNPNTAIIEGDKCYPDLKSLPDEVTGAVVVVPPAQSEKVIKSAYEKGIKNIWLQQGAHSDKAVEICEEKGMNYVKGECILMFAEPVTSIHKFHRWIWKLIGKYPK